MSGFLGYLRRRRRFFLVPLAIGLACVWLFLVAREVGYVSG